MLGIVALWGHIRFLSPSRAGTKVLGALSSSVVSATVSHPYLLELQIYLIQMIALFGRCPESSSALLILLSSPRQLVALIPSPTCALSLPVV